MVKFNNVKTEVLNGQNVTHRYYQGMMFNGVLSSKRHQLPNGYYESFGYVLVVSKEFESAYRDPSKQLAFVGEVLHVFQDEELLSDDDREELFPDLLMGTNPNFKSKYLVFQ